jgi:hypothetical protein
VSEVGYVELIGLINALLDFRLQYHCTAEMEQIIECLLVIQEELKAHQEMMDVGQEEMIAKMNAH